MTQDQVISDFIADPQACVKNLIRTQALRREARLWLADFLLQNPRPEFAEFSWIFLMPWYLSIDFTQGFCNLDCRMCSGRAERRAGKFEYVTRTQFRTILNHVPTASVVALPSNSSDPLMNPDFLQVLDILQRCGLAANTVCNGHLLKPKIISALAAYPYHFEFNVSIDSHNPDKYREIRKGELQPVLNNLTALREERDKHPESGLSINIMTVGMEDNIEDLSGIVRMCHQIGADKCKVQHLAGDQSPGDYILNPRWQTAVFDALVEAERLGVRLILPRDALLQVEANLQTLLAKENVALDEIVTHEDEEEQQLQASSPRKYEIPRPETRDPVPSTPPEKTIICSRFDNVHVRFGGELGPCCHVGYPTELNIYDRPLYQDMTFLKYRLQLFSGDVFDACHAALNCHCMQEHRLKASR